MKTNANLLTSSSLDLSHEKVFLRSIPTNISLGNLSIDSLRLLVYFLAKGSPYELAVEAGYYKGSLSEWLQSLKANLTVKETVSKYEDLSSLSDLKEGDMVFVQETNLMYPYSKNTFPSKENGLDIKGLSAYDIAVKNGFDGTEKQWLDSLKATETAVEGLTEEQLKTITEALREDLLPEDVVKQEQLEKELSSKLEANDIPSLVEPLLKKDYEINIEVKNLFNQEDLIKDYFLSTANGGLSKGTNWTVSNFIPVQEGQTYTLSGERARQGISFLAHDQIDGSPALLYDNTATLPLTVTAPVGSKFVVIALESASAKGWSNIQFEEGSQATTYQPYGEAKNLIDSAKVYGLNESLSQISEKLDTEIFSLKESIKEITPKESLQGFSKLLLNNGEGSLSNEDLSLQLRVYRDVSYAGREAFNFISDTYQKTQVRLMGDDVAPVRMMEATIGANHGYSRSNLTVVGHDKTTADVGSVWTDGTNEWVLVQINSDSVLGITCRTKHLTYSASQLPALTHVSGATNKASFKPTSSVGAQWYPMLKNHQVKVITDGVENTEKTVALNFADHLKIVESYDLMEKNDIAEWLITHGGKEVKQYEAESALNVTHVHCFDAKTLSDTISCNFFCYKALSAAQDLMFTQSARMNAVNNEVLYYVPRSVPFVHELVSYDFGKPTNVADLTISTRIDFTQDKTEPNAVLPDRLVMLAGDLGYATGYLPILDAAPDVRNQLTSKGIQISNSAAKVYPYIVDGLSTLDAGAHYSCVAYRTYFKRPKEVRRTAEYQVKHGQELYYFLDWHDGDFIDVIELDASLQGRSFTVLEQTENVEILSNVLVNSLVVKLGNISSNARLVLKVNLT